MYESKSDVLGIISLVFVVISVVFSIYFLVSMCYNHISYDIEGQNEMDYTAIISTVGAAVAALAGLITTILNIHFKRKDKLDIIKSLIGDDPQKLSISDQIGVKKGEMSLVNLIGLNQSEGTLSSQHKDIVKHLDKQKSEIFSIFEKQEIEKNEQYKKFSKKQKRTLETINEMKLFFEDWEKLNQRVSDLDAENKRLVGEQYKTICKLLSKDLSPIEIEQLLEVPREKLIEAREWGRDNMEESETSQSDDESLAEFQLKR